MLILEVVALGPIHGYAIAQLLWFWRVQVFTE
jgi:hypothetical protein